MLFKEQIPIGEASIEDEAYALGWVKAKLSRQLSIVGRNDSWLGHGKVPAVGKKSAGKIVMYHHDDLVGMLSSVFLIPESNTAIIAMSNTHPLADPTDGTDQLILETILESESSHDVVQLTEDTKYGQLAAYSTLTDQLDSTKIGREPRRDHKECCGEY